MALQDEQKKAQGEEDGVAQWVQAVVVVGVVGVVGVRWSAWGSPIVAVLLWRDQASLWLPGLP